MSCAVNCCKQLAFGLTYVSQILETVAMDEAITYLDHHVVKFN